MPAIEKTEFVAFVKSMSVLNPERHEFPKALLEELWVKHEYEDRFLNRFRYSI